MPKIFPTLPILPPPDWIEPIDLTGDTATQNQTLANGAISRLQVSEVQTNAEFRVRWHNCVTDSVVAQFNSFYKIVGKWESFSIPIAFWNPNYPIAKRDMIIDSSPTGYWMFKDKKVTPINSKEWTIEATFISVID
jgi:hypothetical protein